MLFDEMSGHLDRCLSSRQTEQLVNKMNIAVEAINVRSRHRLDALLYKDERTSRQMSQLETDRIALVNKMNISVEAINI